MNFQFAQTGASVAPGDWNCSPGVSAYNRLQRNFYGEIEVWRDQWFATANDCAPISFKSIGDVVVINAEERFYKKIGEPIEQ